MDARIFETGSQQWISFDGVGDAVFTRDKDRAAIIEASQFESYIRNYELEYIRNTLVIEMIEMGSTG